MDTPNVAESDGVERSGEHPESTPSKRDETAPFLMPREVKVAIAVQKLVSRELDGTAELEATAKRLLDTGFMSA